MAGPEVRTLSIETPVEATLSLVKRRDIGAVSRAPLSSGPRRLGVDDEVVFTDKHSPASEPKRH